MTWLSVHALHIFWAFLALCLAENVARAMQQRALVSRFQYPLGSVSLLVELGLRNLTLPIRLWVFTAVAAWVPWKFDDSIVLFGVTYLCCDFIYYWKHRWMHVSDFGWALHAPHHSPDELNLMTGIRLGWVQRQLDDFFFLPALLTGIPPEALLLIVLVNEAFPFWLHTETIGRLGLWERVFNSPQAHRLHHHPEVGVSCNFGSTFTLWDRLFGTFSLDWATATYGISEFPRPNHLAYAQFWYLARWLRLRLSRHIATFSAR